MDLYAYQFMEGHFDLEKFIKDFNLPIHRLRGCRYMPGEDPQYDCLLLGNDEKAYIAQSVLEDINHYCGWDTYKHKCLIFNKKDDCFPSDLDMSKLHGKARKVVKFEIKKTQRARTLQMELFNKYAGKDVLLIHTRTGGGNRSYYEMDNLAKHEMYIDDCDDSFDGTYADIYINIKNIDLEPYFKKELGHEDGE